MREDLEKKIIVIVIVSEFLRIRASLRRASLRRASLCASGLRKKNNSNSSKTKNQQQQRHQQQQQQQQLIKKYLCVTQGNRCVGT